VSVLATWLATHATRTAPLFLDEDLVVAVFRRGRLEKLRRHPAFDALMIETVQAGLADPEWLGLLYVMHWRRPNGIVPLYIGKAERRGVTNELSANLRDIARNHGAFGRWGYGLAYHVGDLSHVLFGGPGYKPPERKYRRWAEALFASHAPPRLREPVHVAIVSWRAGMRGPSGLVGSVAAVEKELIALAGAEGPDDLLNTDGR
jgi:hypothetical protein